MRVNVYAEELPEEGSVEIIGKEINGHVFTGLRIPLYLPVTLPDGTQARGKFMHHPDDDDSSAITIWGKQDLRRLLVESMTKLNDHYKEGSAITDVLLERQRQIDKEGFELKHDDEHDAGELAGAGAAYALFAANTLHPYSQGDGFDGEPPPGWCWDEKWWKPKTPREDLVRAAALIVAEIERLDRAG